MLQTVPDGTVQVSDDGVETDGRELWLSEMNRGEIISKTFNVPSLFLSCSLEGRFEDEELQQILDDIQTKRSFQY